MYQIPFTPPTYEGSVQPGQTQTIPVNLWTQPVPITWNVYARPGISCPRPEWMTIAGKTYATAGFRLKVRNQVIFADAPTSTRRKCTLGYNLGSVYVPGNRFVATVYGYRFGVETPTVEAIYIAGILE